MEENEIASKVCLLALQIHRELGPGLYESTYQKAFEYELRKKGLRFESEKPILVKYKDIYLDNGYIADLIIENKLLVELKSVEQFSPVHFKQIQTYLKATDIKLGLLINFNVVLIKDGMKRFINGLEPDYRKRDLL
jgi:GxxExxY protein